MECQRQRGATPAVVHSISRIAFQNSTYIMMHDISLLEDAQDSLYSSIFGDVCTRSNAKYVFVTLCLKCQRVHAQLAFVVSQLAVSDLLVGVAGR